MAFRSVFVDGKISNPATGRVKHLHILGENKLPYLESAEINLERGANMNMSINLAPPYAQAIGLISKDNEWIRLGNTLGLRWGYSDVPGAISDWYYGFIQPPEVSFGDEISVSIPATTLAWNADRVERTRSWASEESPRSFRSIAEEIASRYGLKVDFGDIENLTPLSKELIDEPRTAFVQGGRTDLQFLMMEAEKYGMRMISLSHILYFVDAAAPLPGYPDVNATFQYYGKINIEKNVYPMTSFDPESMGTMFIKQFQGVNSLAYGPNDDPTVEKEPIVSTDKIAQDKAFTSKETVANPPETDGKPPQGMGDVKTKATIKVDPSAGEGGKMFSLPLNGNETEGFIEGILSGAREASSEDHGIPVNFGSIAIPNLLPGMFVGLQGVGDYFTGTYMLQTMGLSFDSGGAEMACGAFGRGFPGVDRQINPFVAEMESHIDPVRNEHFDSLLTDWVEPYK